MTFSSRRLSFAVAFAANIVAAPAYLFCLLPFINSDSALMGVMLAILLVCIALAILWSRQPRAAAAAQVVLLAIPMVAIIDASRNAPVSDWGAVWDPTLIGYLLLVLTPVGLFAVSLILLVRRKRQAKT